MIDRASSVLLGAVCALSLGACADNYAVEGAGVGAAAGAAIGAVTGGDVGTGAAIGAAAGAAGGRWSKRLMVTAIALTSVAVNMPCVVPIKLSARTG